MIREVLVKVLISKNNCFNLSLFLYRNSEVLIFRSGGRMSLILEIPDRNDFVQN